jgi:hypothetical protein
MGMIEDIMKALDRWDVWREVQQLPAKWVALEKRVEELERKLGEKHAPDECKFCGARAVRLNATLGPNEKGKIMQHWVCKDCNKTEVRVV